jgi:hypothetical protein
MRQLKWNHSYAALRKNRECVIAIPNRKKMMTTKLSYGI